VDAAAISLLGLESALDGRPLQESITGENRGSVPEQAPIDRDSAHVTSSLRYMPCDVHRALLHCPPGSSQSKGSGHDPVQIAPIGPTYRYS
jgi:hypothetical protein